jgi:hypothetical protein
LIGSKGVEPDDVGLGSQSFQLEPGNIALPFRLRDGYLPGLTPQGVKQANRFDIRCPLRDLGKKGVPSGGGGVGKDFKGALRARVFCELEEQWK